MPRRKQTLAELLPSKADREKIEELVYMVRVAHDRNWSLGPKRRPIHKAIRQLSKAPDMLRFLRLNWVGQTAQMALEREPSPVNLGLLETDLRRACLALEKRRVTMQRAKHPFLDDAIARFVAYVWERTGQPRHEIAASLLRPILGPEYAHNKWCQNHRRVIDSHRRVFRRS